MKIVGYTYWNGEHHFTMKCDASLLQGRKPMFLPDWSEDVRMSPCLVVRISRLGKCIAPKFASRYYDAVAPGLDFTAVDWLNRNYSRATAFESSLCVGDFAGVEDLNDSQQTQIAQAIADASTVVTLRMGDLLYIDTSAEPQAVQSNLLIEQERLYCKIK